MALHITGNISHGRSAWNYNFFPKLGCAKLARNHVIGKRTGIKHCRRRYVSPRGNHLNPVFYFGNPIESSSSDIRKLNYETPAPVVALLRSCSFPTHLYASQAPHAWRAGLRSKRRVCVRVAVGEGGLDDPALVTTASRIHSLRAFRVRPP